MGKVTHRSIIVCLTVYIFMGFFGYVNFRTKTCGNILKVNQTLYPKQRQKQRFFFLLLLLLLWEGDFFFPTLEHVHIVHCVVWADLSVCNIQNFRDSLDDADGVVIGAYICIALTILMAYPLVIFPCRYTVEVMLEASKGSHFFAKPSALRHFVVTLMISGGSLLLSLFVPNISVVFQVCDMFEAIFFCFDIHSQIGLNCCS
jgi:hypothetical protein